MRRLHELRAHGPPAVPRERPGRVARARRQVHGHERLPRVRRRRRPAQRRPGHAVAQLLEDRLRRDEAVVGLGPPVPPAHPGHVALGARALRPGGRRPRRGDVLEAVGARERRRRVGPALARGDGPVDGQRRVDRVRVVVGRPRVERQRHAAHLPRDDGPLAPLLQQPRRLVAAQLAQRAAARRRRARRRGRRRPRGAVVVAVARVRRGPGRRRPPEDGAPGQGRRRQRRRPVEAALAEAPQLEARRRQARAELRARQAGRAVGVGPVLVRVAAQREDLGARPEQARQQARGAVGVARPEPLEAPPVDRRVEAPRGGGARPRARRTPPRARGARPRPRPRVGLDEEAPVGDLGPRRAPPRRPARRRRRDADDEAAARRREADAVDARAAPELRGAPAPQAARERDDLLLRARRRGRARRRLGLGLLRGHLCRPPALLVTRPLHAQQRVAHCLPC